MNVYSLKQFLKRLHKWELWPFYMIYAPLGFLWLYYMLRARAVWFFSNVNPTLEFSGFEGESKKEMYEQLAEKYYPKTMFVSAGQVAGDVVEECAAAGFVYPFIAKPQIGMHGLMFRKIENEAQLRKYHRYINTECLIQEFVNMPMEFSVFHIRYPGEKKGKITGFILKDYLAVTGDGRSTIAELIKAHPKASLREEEMRKRHYTALGKKILHGEKFFLSISGNHNRGTKFINLAHEIDEALCSVFDNISNEAGHFYFGRYDLKCTSIED